MKFTKETLGEEIKKQWGEYGAHYEVYKMMLDQVKSNQKQSSITAVVQAKPEVCECEKPDLFYSRLHSSKMCYLCMKRAN
jgi:hypothetical protein